MSELTKRRILSVDDCEEIHLAVNSALSEDFLLESSTSCLDAMGRCRSEKFDLIILDVMLGDGTGIDLCKALRELPSYSRTPILLLSGIAEVGTKVSGLRSGADDYITKPFDPTELHARVDALLRRTGVPQDTLEFGPMQFDLALQRVTIVQEGKACLLDLTPVEFRILLNLAQRRPQPVSRNELLRTIWPRNVHVIPENIYTHIHAIRKKLMDYCVQLESVRGEGYTLYFDDEQAPAKVW